MGLRALLESYGKGLCLVWNDNTDIDAVRAARAAGWSSTYWERGSGWHSCRDEAAASSLLQEVDHLLANSHAGRRILELRWGVRRPIEVLRNGVRPSALPRELRPRSRPEGLVRIGVAGRLTAVKGPAVALHAARVLADSGIRFTLEFAGTGPLEGDLRILARRLALGDRVVFHGALADMNGFYQDMHLLLHTALREPCANVVPEAHAHGLPCLATLIDGMPELLPEGSHKLLLKPTEDLDAYQELGASGGAMAPWVYDPSTDSLVKPRFVAPTACAEAILELWNTDGAYEQASLRAVNLVRDEFLPEMAIGRAVRVLGDIVKGGRGN